MRKNVIIFFTLVEFCFLLLTVQRGFSQSSELFKDDKLLEMTLSGDVTGLMKDRGEDPKYHTFKLSYKDSNDNLKDVPVQIKTRGHFRKMKQNCNYPPLLLNFSKVTSANSIFSEQDKIKLVTPCRDEKYVVREYLVYKMYNLITPKSFKARLVKFDFVSNDPKAKDIEPMYGILLEEEEQMAKRNNAVSVETLLVKPQQTQVDDFLNMAVFEYLIGNTDWSVQYRQNVKLIAKDSMSVTSTVPYDFDHAGIIAAPYALPAPELELESTRERRYRGYCINDVKQFDGVLSIYNQHKDDLYKLYTESTLLDEGFKKSTVKYLDEFYKTINDPKTLKSEFQYPCQVDGTGNVVIKGLKKN
jgi:23S rRNA maturation mini-RNase III